MATLTVTSKGQVTLRRELLAHLGVSPGETIAVDKLPGGRIEVRAGRRRGRISDVFGRLAQPDGQTLTLDEISDAIADGWAGER